MSNWGKLDYFLPMALAKEENALIDLVGGKVAVNENATKVFEGFDFDGVDNAILSNYTPSIHGENYVLADASIGAFCYTSDEISDSAGIWGGRPADAHSRFYGISDTNRYFTLNGGAFGSIVSTGFKSRTNYVSHRSATQIFMEVDGIQDAGNSTPDTVTNIPLYIGAMTEVNGFPFGFMTGALSLFHAGAGIGVNQVAKNDHYREFLEGLGLDLNP